MGRVDTPWRCIRLNFVRGITLRCARNKPERFASRVEKTCSACYPDGLADLMSAVNASKTNPVSIPHILVVEDEEKMRSSVVEGLMMEGWRISTAAEGTDAMAQIDRKAFDLLILDWMLPGHDGLEVLNHLRTRGIHTPVLMLTVRDSVSDRVTGLEAGADDYLTKPFAFAELVARTRALLRRPAHIGGSILQYGDLHLDARARVATRGGCQIPLTPREVDILEYMLRFQGQVVTREMLERDVWRQTRRFTSLNNVIDVQMMRLRKKVDTGSAERLLHTLRGVGYRLGGEEK